MTVALLEPQTGARALMERVLRGGAPLAPEYPLVFDDEFPGRIVAVGEDGEALSACAVLERELVTPAGRARVGFVGSVTTDPAHRGRGLATRVLIEAEAALQCRGAALALLWADDPRFYYQRGWRPFGTEVDFQVPRELAPRLPDPAGARPFEPRDAAAVHALYTQHPERVERTPEETASLLACPGMDALVLERDGDLTAYACRGRGADLAAVVHEWAGPPDAVLALLRAHLERHAPAPGTEALFLMTPPSATTLHDRLAALGAPTSVGILGLGKVLDRGAAAALLDSLVRPEGEAAVVPTPEGERFLLRGPGGEGALDEDGLLSLLFPSFGKGEEVEELKEAFGLTSARFPLWPFVWGLDSI